MQIPVLLDRSRSESLTDQLIEQLRNAISQARLAPGTRLPSSRRLAEQLAVSRNTVIRAYDALIIEGQIESRPASGIYVADAPVGAPAISGSRAAAALSRSASHMPMPPLLLRPDTILDANRMRLSFDFDPARTNPSLFPVKTWRRLLQSSLSHGGAAGISHDSDAAGLPALRSAIASQLATTRGIAADPSRILIVSGAQEGISIAARLFLNHATLSAVEDPCYQRAAYMFQSTGSEVVSVPIDFDGLIAEELPQRPTALLHLTPSHQYPTGHTLSLARREAIVTWARRCGCYILEDDRDSEFCYEGSPLLAIAASAPDCTIYLGTFARTMGAGLRLGYMVVPEQLAAVVGAAKALFSNGNAWIDQAALAEMMRTNSYTSHVSRLRAIYKESRDILMDALRRNFGDVSVTGENGGLHLLWYLPPGVPDAPIVESLARRARIGVYSLASAGAYVARLSTLAQRGVMLGYAALSRKQIEQGIARLSDAIDDAVDDHKVDVDKLYTSSAIPIAALSRPVGSSRHLDSTHRRQPALAARRPRIASSERRVTGHVGNTMVVVNKIYRYPVKGLSAQPLASVALEVNTPFPHDRVFALARPGAPIDVENPGWAKKGLFAMLMLDEGLARVQTRFDIESDRLTVMQGNQQVASCRLSDDAERAALEDFFWKLLPSLPSPPILVRSRGGHFMDKPDSVISLINLATVRQLQEQWGFDINPLRFRANIYIDGAEPWEEFDWIGSDVRIGSTVFGVDRKNGRCGATNVNPVTGRRDLDIPSSLRDAFGHKNLGVYLMVRERGQISVGDMVDAPRSAQVQRLALAPLSAANGVARSFICRGCYFIYEEDKGLPQQSILPHTHFADIPATWRCPDCGTEKATFRPYVAKGGANMQ